MPSRFGRGLESLVKLCEGDLLITEGPIPLTFVLSVGLVEGSFGFALGAGG